MQVTRQDYRDAFIDENLSLTTASIHREVLQTFIRQGKKYKMNGTTRDIFFYLMFNANADKRSATFGEVSDVRYAEIADYIGKTKNTIEKEIVKLCKADLLERHPVKSHVFIIPSMHLARQQLADQSYMKKRMQVTEQAEKQIALEERDGTPVTERERKIIYASWTRKVMGNQKGEVTHPDQKKIPF